MPLDRPFKVRSPAMQVPCTVSLQHTTALGSLNCNMGVLPHPAGGLLGIPRALAGAARDALRPLTGVGL